MSEEDNESKHGEGGHSKMNQTEMIHPNETCPPVLQEPAGQETENQLFGVNNPNLDETADAGNPNFGDLQLGTEVIEKFARMIFPLGSSKLKIKTYDDYTDPDGGKWRRFECVSNQSRVLVDIASELKRLNSEGAGIFLDPNYSEIRLIFVDDNTIRDKPRDDWPIPPSLILETSKGRYNYLYILDYTSAMTTEAHLGINRRLVKEWGHNKFSMGVNSPIRIPGTFNCKSNEAFPCEIVGGSEEMVSESDMVKAFPPLPPLHGNLFDLQNGELNLPTEGYALVEVVQEALGSLPFPVFDDDRNYPTSEEEMAIIDQWLKNGEALKSEFGEDGFILWDNWCEGLLASYEIAVQNWQNYPGEGKSSLSIETVFQHAFENGMGRTSSEPNRLYDKLIPLNKIEIEQSGEWQIKKVIPKNEIIIIAGYWGTAKTFFAIDMGMAIARGSKWRKFKTEQTGVVIASLEGKKGIKKRIEACIQHNNLKVDDVPFFTLPTNLDLRTSDQGARELINMVKMIHSKQGIDVGVIIIDTLSRALAGGDENGPVDMGKLIANLSIIQDELGATIILIHHQGTNTKKETRGHSSLPAAVNTIITMQENTNGVFTGTTGKQKDEEGGLKFPFRLEQVVVGEDKDGDPITSCVVEHLDQVVEHKPAPKLKGKNFETMQLLCEVLPEKSVARPAGSSTIPDGERVITDDDYCDAYLQSGISGAAKEADQKRAYRRARDYLVDKGFIGIDGDHIWIIDPHHKSLASPES